MTPQLSQVLVRLRQVFAARALSLVEIGHGIQAETVDPHAQPLVDDVEQRPPHVGVIEVKVRLVGVEAVPVICFRGCVPGPVRGFEIFEDDPGVAVALGSVAPDIEVALAAAGRRGASALEPRVLV